MPDADVLRRRVEALLASDRVTPATRRALGDRLTRKPQPLQVLTADQIRTLQAVAARLTPLEGLEIALDLPGRLDAQLAAGPGDGWRYAALPPDAIAAGMGLEALETTSQAVHGCRFADLRAEAQDALLTEVQRGRPAGPTWPFPSELWFEEVLASLARLAYAHPLTQVSIGYDGFADAHGVAPRA